MQIFQYNRDNLKQMLGDKLSDHEILTLARNFAVKCVKDKFSDETLR